MTGSPLGVLTPRRSASAKVAAEAGRARPVEAGSGLRIDYRPVMLVGAAVLAGAAILGWPQTDPGTRAVASAVAGSFSEATSIGQLVATAAGVVVLATLLVTLRRARRAATHAHAALVEARTGAERSAEAEVRLRRRVEALGVIIAGAAHEFNNVVMAVQAGARMARKRADRPGEVDRIAGMMEDAADRGAELTASLLAFARRDEGRTQAFDVCASVAAVADLLDRTLGLTIELDCDSAFSAVRGDQGEFETVLVRLLIGLRKPTARDGPILVRTRTELDAPEDATPGLPAKAHFLLTIGLEAAAEGGRLSTTPSASAVEDAIAAGEAFAAQNGGALHASSGPDGGATIALRLALTKQAEPAPAEAA